MGEEARRVVTGRLSKEALCGRLVDVLEGKRGSLGGSSSD
jgi:hypothetical protein